MNHRIAARGERIAPNELAFDIDGVFADTFRVFVDTAKGYGVSVEYEDITEYDFREVIDIDEETSNKIIRKILDNPLAMGIPPVHGAVGVLKRLSQLGPLLFVTARPEREAIFKWVEETLQPADTSVIRLEATSTHTEKLPILLEYGVRYFIEDRLDTCYLLEKTPITPIVFEQPWNRKPHPFRIVKNWFEIEALIQW
jgi:hypothetical protein